MKQAPQRFLTRLRTVALTASLAVICAACGGDGEDGVNLSVVLVTDYSPTSEFESAQVTLKTESGKTVTSGDWAYEDGADTIGGHVIGQFQDVPQDTHTVLVDLINASGGAVAGANTVVSTTDNSEVVVAVLRDREFVPLRFNSNDDEQIRTFSLASAGWIHEFMRFAVPGVGVPGGSCPDISEDGGVRTLVGGCSAGGVAWGGRAEVTGNAAVSSALGGFDENEPVNGKVVYDGLTVSAENPCDGSPMTWVVDGTVTFLPTDSGYTFSTDRLEFELDFKEPSACEGRTYAGYTTYEGTTAENADESTTIAGEGLFAEYSFGALQVKTTAQTVNEGTCAKEPFSGNTTAQMGPNRIEFRYDGAQGCDDRTPLFVDGVKQPKQARTRF